MRDVIRSLRQAVRSAFGEVRQTLVQNRRLDRDIMLYESMTPEELTYVRAVFGDQVLGDVVTDLESRRLSRLLYGR